MSKTGANNPNWKGGRIAKECAICGSPYEVKRANKGSRYCSLKCVGISQRGQPRPVRSRVDKQCPVCLNNFSVPLAHKARQHCCSKDCSFKRRAQLTSGASNPNWAGGISGRPYPWDFRKKSKEIIARDGGCMNPNCAGGDPRLTTHHINYEKSDCRDENLICLCSACNSKANFGRDAWEKFYANIMVQRLKNEWKEERF